MRGDLLIQRVNPCLNLPDQCHVNPFVRRYAGGVFDRHVLHPVFRHHGAQRFIRVKCLLCRIQAQKPRVLFQFFSQCFRDFKNTHLFRYFH